MLFDFLGLYPYYDHKILTWVTTQVLESGFRVQDLNPSLTCTELKTWKPPEEALQGLGFRV